MKPIDYNKAVEVLEGMENKIRKYRILAMDLKHMQEMKKDLERGKSLQQLRVFDANVRDLVEVPEIHSFRDRLKQIIQTEVDIEISRIEKEIYELTL